MDMAKFIQAVNESPHYEGIGITNDGEVLIRELKTGETVIVPTEALCGANWNDIDDVLSGKNHPGALGIRSAAPGYYGRSSRWPAAGGGLAE